MKIQADSSQEIFERLVQLAQAKTYLLSDIWYRSRKQFGQEWLEEVVENVSRLFGSQEKDWEEAILGYAEFSRDGMRYQEFFETHGHYRFSTFKESSTIGAR